MKDLEIQEKDLELIISNKQLGNLTTNAKDIKALIEASLPNYDIQNYKENNIDAAKKDKAMLNKAAKILIQKSFELEKEFNKPFEEFKSVITEVCKVIENCSGKIDEVISSFEEEERKIKRILIQEYWDVKAFSLVSLTKIFESKWLYKDSDLKSVYAEIDSKIVKIQEDFATLEAIGVDVEQLKYFYSLSLDLNSTINYAVVLRINRDLKRKLGFR